jgi:hypothetical protein
MLVFIFLHYTSYELHEEMTQIRVDYYRLLFIVID